MLTIDEIANASNAKVLNGNADVKVKSYCIDSREFNKEDFFIPILGEKVDGHDYILDVVKKGAIGFFISKNYIKKDEIIKNSININKNICIIEVQDTTQALYDIAIYNRKKNIDIPIVAVTGSVGKTSTREMIASVLSEKYNLLVTRKNFNSIVGLPLMILELDNQDIGVLEAGIDHIGEMDILSNILKPDVCVITKIGVAHIGIFGSQEKIFEEKVKIANNIKGIKALIINQDDKFLSKLKDEKYNIIRYSLNDVEDKVVNENSLEFKTKIYDEMCNITINQIGEHNIQNALSAIKVAEVFKMEPEKIISGIKKYKNFNGRMQIKKIKNNISIIDDTYNASIDSIKSGLVTINELKAKRKIIVLGDMFELGDFSKEIHLKTGELFKEIKCDILYTFGNEAKNIALTAKKYIEEVRCFDDMEDLQNDIVKNMKDGDIIYFKASNGMKLSKIVNNILEM